MATSVNESPKKFLGTEFAADLTTVFTPTIPAGTNHVNVQALLNSVLWRPDAQTPAGDDAFLLLPGEYLNIHSDSLEDLRFIQGSAGAKLALAYYR